MAKPSVRRFMTVAPVIVASEAPVAEAHRAMRDRGIRHLPVVERGALVGVVSQRDLYLLGTLGGVDPATATVEEAMSPDPFQVGPDAPLHEVAAEMARRRIGSTVVVEHGEIVGVFNHCRRTVRALAPLAGPDLVGAAAGAGPAMTHPRATPAATRPTRATLAGNPGETAGVSIGTGREFLAAMGRLEADAREALLRRRRTLVQAPAPVAVAAHDPAARWSDYESAPSPPVEGTRVELAEIDAALDRIREGRYGVCQSCGGPMGLQRLRAIPEARYCLACTGQDAHE